MELQTKYILSVLIVTSILFSLGDSSSILSQYEAGKITCSIQASSLDGDYFRHLMETKTEVDLVRIRLEWVGQDLNYSSADNFDPDYWVWASHNSGEALLSLPFDVDILSLGTLTKDVFSMNINMVFEPELCNQILTDAEKVLLVAQALQKNVTSGYVDASLCHRVVSRGTEIVYRCCEPSSFKAMDDCDITVRKHSGITYSLIFIEVLSVIAVLYLPLIITYLPRPQYHDPSEFGTEQHLMYLNAEVPVGIGKLWRIIYLTLSSRGKRLILFFLILPGITVSWNLLYFFLKNRELALRISRNLFTPPCTIPFLKVVFDPSPLRIAGVCILVVFMLFLAISVCIPGNTDRIYHSLTKSGECACLTCKIINSVLNVPTPLVNTKTIKSFQSFLLAHLKIHIGNPFLKGLKLFFLKPYKYFKNTILSSICFLFLFFPSVIIVIALVLALTPVFITIMFLVSAVIIQISENTNACFSYVTHVIIFLILFAGSLGYAFVVFFTSILQLMRLFGFTIMGLLVHAEFYVPFIVYVLSLAYYFWNYWHQLYLRYFKLKMSIFQECEKQGIAQAKTGESPVGIIFYSKTNVPAIPRDLFYVVCRELMPVRVSVAVTLFKFIVILIFLSFVLSCIISFGKFRDFSALTKTLVTFAMSSLPKLFSMLGSSSHSDVSKAQRQHKLSFIISEYAAGRITYTRYQGDTFQQAHAEEATPSYYVQLQP